MSRLYVWGSMSPHFRYVHAYLHWENAEWVSLSYKEDTGFYTQAGSVTRHTVCPAVYTCLDGVGPCPSTAQECIWAHVHVRSNPCPSSGPFYPGRKPTLYLSNPGWRAPLVSPQIDDPLRAAGGVSAHRESSPRKKRSNRLLPPLPAEI